MLEQLGQTQGKLYSRAVDPALESRLRVRDTSSTTPTDKTDVKASQSSSEQARHPLSRYQEMSQGHGQVEQRPKEIADELTRALRQAKQTPVRFRGGVTLETHTGRQANQSYLSGGHIREARIVDELA